MVRLVFFTDPHFTLTPPECRGDGYARELLEKLHEIAHAATKVRATAIACAGDWYHRKGRASFQEANALLAILSNWREKGFAVAGILGNHDIAGHALESLDGRAGGALVRSRAMHLLDLSPLLVEDAGGSIYLTGTSYFHGCDSSDEARLRMYGAEPPPPPKKKEDPPSLHVHLAHATLLNRGEFFENYTTAEKLIPLLEAAGRLPDVIACGHLHFPEGVVAHRSPLGRTVHVVRIGSLGRVAADDLERRPTALVIAYEHGRAVFRPFPVGKPASRPEGAAPGDPRDPGEREARIKDFVRVLRESSEAWELADHRKLLREIVDRLGHGEDVYELVLSSVEKRQ